MLQQLKKLFKSYPEIKLVYFFGSRATKKASKLSDYDFAVYFACDDREKIFDIRLDLIAELSKLLKTDNVDVLVLNETESPEMKYFIIKEGKLIYEVEPYKVLVEPKILNEYFDFDFMLKKHGLTKI